MLCLSLIHILPYTVYSNATLPGEDASVEVLITWLYTGGVLRIVGMIVYQILVIPLEMTYYILADKPELKSTEAMKESLEMMHEMCIRDRSTCHKKPLVYNIIMKGIAGFLFEFPHQMVLAYIISGRKRFYRKE